VFVAITVPGTARLRFPGPPISRIVPVSVPKPVLSRAFPQVAANGAKGPV